MSHCYVTDEWVVEAVRRTRTEQGFPPRITDPVALDKVAALVRPWLEEQQTQAPERAA